MTSGHTTATRKIGEDFSPGTILTSIEDLQQDGVLPESVVRIAGARVVYANYNLLKHDFPQLAGLVLEKDIDEWLLRHTAFISQNQAKQSFVNSPINTGNEEVTAFRPPGYGRAVVFSIEENDKALFSTNKRQTVFENRLIDVKGSGVAPHAEAVNGSHCNGIYRLGYAFVELIFQELLQRIFRHSKTSFQTLPLYAIIDAGFDETNGYIPATPAALMIRRAHRRLKNSGGLYPYNSTGQLVQVEIEKLLRKYGITSVNSVTTVKISGEEGKLRIQYGDQLVDFFNDKEREEIERVSHYKEGMNTISFDGINIQHIREISLDPPMATLVDFQSYTVKERFDNPFLSFVSDKLLRWGGTIWPGDDDFIDPDPLLKIPFHLVSATGNIFGYDMGGGRMKIDSLCYGLAQDIRTNKINREQLLTILQSYLDSLTQHWTND